MDYRDRETGLWGLRDACKSKLALKRHGPRYMSVPIQRIVVVWNSLSVYSMKPGAEFSMDVNFATPLSPNL